MPNHCQNRIKVFGPNEALKRIAAECFIEKDDDDASGFNFAAIVPYPEGFDRSLRHGWPDLDIWAAYYQPDSLRVMGNESIEQKAQRIKDKYSVEDEYRNLVGSEIFSKYPTAEKLAEAYDRNLQIGNSLTSYDWQCDNWGTKWNAYDGCQAADFLDDDCLIFGFTTAWSPPSKVLQAMADKYGVVVENHWNEEGGEYGFDHFHPAPPIYDEQEAIG